jgi:hypothetical protein
MFIQGSPRNFGRPDVLHVKQRKERPLEQAPGPESRQRLPVNREARKMSETNKK